MSRRIKASVFGALYAPPGVSVPAPRVRKIRATRQAVPGALERPTQQAVVAWLRRVIPPGSIVQCIRNERQPKSDDQDERARFHKAREKDGYAWGFPDLLVCLSSGCGLLIEMKRPGGGVVSDRQAGMHTRLRSLGWTVIVADSIESARHGLRAAGIPLRESDHEPAYPAKFRVEKAQRVAEDALPW